jgi:3-oxoacyl-[acyl-carrier protein] reductase
MDFKGRTAVVTGGARGIGKAIAEGFARGGAGVVIADITAEEAEKTAREMEGLGVKAMALRLDVSSAESVSEVFESVVREMGRVDILVNNAGITKDGLLLRMKEEDWDAVMNINLKGVFLCTKEAVKSMARQRYGRIVNISSVVAFMGNAGQVNYSASKAGIVGLTKTVAREYASRGVTVNAVAPGFISTAMTDALSEGVREDMRKAVPLGRFGTVQDVASAVLFLASSEAGYVTGHVLHVNGGMYM